MGDIDSLSSLWPTNKPEPANTNVEQLLAQMHDLSFMLKDELSVPDKPIDHSKPWSGNNKNCVLLLSAKEDRCWKSNIFGAGRIAPNIPEWKMQVKSQKTLFQLRAFYQSIGQQRIVFVFSVASLHWSSVRLVPWLSLREAENHVFVCLLMYVPFCGLYDVQSRTELTNQWIPFQIIYAYKFVLATGLPCLQHFITVSCCILQMISCWLPVTL